MAGSYTRSYAFKKYINNTTYVLYDITVQRTFIITTGQFALQPAIRITIKETHKFNKTQNSAWLHSFAMCSVENALFVFYFYFGSMFHMVVCKGPGTPGHVYVCPELFLLQGGTCSSLQSVLSWLIKNPFHPHKRWLQSSLQACNPSGDKSAALCLGDLHSQMDSSIFVFDTF